MNNGRSEVLQTARNEAKPVTEPENMSFSDLLMLPDDETMLLNDLSRPLILLSPLHDSPTPLLSEREQEIPVKMDARKYEQHRFIHKKKTIETSLSTVKGAQSNSDAGSEGLVGLKSTGSEGAMKVLLLLCCV